MQRTVLIDAYGQIYRSFYAIRNLNNNKGEPVNALFGIARFLLVLDETLPSEYGAAVFDKGKCVRRIELLPDYKAQRPPMPDDLRSQLQQIRVWLEAFGWPLLEKEGFEADDLIASIAAEADEGKEIDIITYDKDLAQLVNEKVSWTQPGKNRSWQKAGTAEIKEKFAVGPEKIVDYLALLGDASDNIPGVKGVGEKTATALLTKYESIEGIYQNINEVKPARIKDNLQNAKDLLLLNRKLIELDKDLLPELKFETLKRKKPDWEKILELAKEQNFNTMTKTAEKKLKEKQANKQQMLF